MRDFFSSSSVGKSELEPVPDFGFPFFLERVPKSKGAEVEPVPFCPSVEAVNAGVIDGSCLLGVEETREYFSPQ